MMNRDMTISQRVTRAADSCELEKVLATHNYLHAASRSYEEWTTVWSKREDTSWAHSFGRMRGFPPFGWAAWWTTTSSASTIIAR